MPLSLPSREGQQGPRTHFRTCNLCEAMCGIAIDLVEAQITAIRGDAEDPFSRGHICPKAVALKDVHADPDRLRRPMRRTRTGWAEIGWEEALSETAERLAATQKAHGRNAVAFYQGNPTVHSHGAILMGQVFARSLRTRNLYSATSVDQLPHMLASLLMFGHQLLLPVPDVDETAFFLVLGANPVASNGSLMTAPGIERRLTALKGRGGLLVVVDPRRTETAALAHTHLPIRPGTDVWLLLSLLQVLFAEGRTRLGRLAAFTDGVEEVAEAAAPYAPERVAGIVGLPAGTIRDLARDFASAPHAVAYGRVGVSTQEFGALSCWLINVLNVVTGNLDRPGGSLFPRPAVDLVALAGRIGLRGHFDKGRSRVRGLPEFGGEYPVAGLADEIETGGDGQVRAVVTLAGNPVLSTPNGTRLDRAFARLDFMASIDYYVNETTRHAHLILPPTAFLERDHYDLVFHMLAVRNTAKYSAPLFAPSPGARHDGEILLDLAGRLDAAKGQRSLLSRLSHATLGRLGPSGVVDLLLRLGPHHLSLRKLKSAPHGIDLGPLESCLPGRLPGGRIDLAPERLLQELRRLSSSEAIAPGLCLVGRRDVRSNNSWMHNSLRLVKGPERCTLLMHPDDARERGLVSGQQVQISSRTGSVEAPLEVTPAIRPGVVSLPHGWGHGRSGVRLNVASAHPGVSLNDLTDESRVDALCGTAAFSGTPVEVAPAPGRASS
jgi:anaerobic selenocysteine-containing dehydrogenase